MPPIPRIPGGYQGPALFSYGFRPFFLLGAIWAAVAVTIWLPFYLGRLALPTALAPVDWHAHEMLYGYVPAIVAGFLLTSIPNWTGRFPLAGRPLIGLVLLWLVGRAAMACSGIIGPIAAAVADTAFLIVFIAACLREVIAGRNWRNLRVLLGLGALAAGNVIFHVETAAGSGSSYGLRIGVASAIAMIMLVGGRIVPSFTRNWLQRRNPGRLPAAFGRLDAVALTLGVSALAAWTFRPDSAASGALLAIGGVAQAIRLARWAGDRAMRDPLVLILHIGYGFVPLGFLLAAASAVMPSRFPPTAATHAWTVGAIGVMTLAVMTRATLSHTGRALTAGIAANAIYVLASVAAFARIAAAMGAPFFWLHVAAASWTAAFTGFALAFGNMIVRPRQQKRAD